MHQYGHFFLFLFTRSMIQQLEARSGAVCTLCNASVHEVTSDAMSDSVISVCRQCEGQHLYKQTLSGV